MDYNLPGSSVHWVSQGKKIRVGCHVLFQGTFPSQGWNPCLPHCRWILYQLSHQGSPIKFTDQGKLEYQTQPKTDIYVNLYKVFRTLAHDVYNVQIYYF